MVSTLKMEMQKVVSIAMATYNGESFLNDQIDSFLAQTRLPDELVVCDDGSTDNTMSILNKFANRATFEVRLYRNKSNLGYSKNFEKAIRKCEGDIILLSDQDDVWFDKKIERVVEEFEDSDPPLVVINDCGLTDKDLNPSGLSKIDQIEAVGMSTDSFEPGCCTAISSMLKPLILPVPTKHQAHDNWIHQVGQVLGKRVVVPDTLQWYRRHGDATSEWFVNRADDSLSEIDTVKAYAVTDPTGPLEGRLEVLKTIESRLEVKKNYITQRLDWVDLGGALDRINAEKKAIRDRIDILSDNSLYRRSWGILKLWRNGGYKYFSGYKSAVKDFVVMPLLSKIG